MAVTRTARLTKRSGTLEVKQSRKGRVEYIVETNDQDDGPFTVIDESGIPQPGQVYAFGNEIDLGLIVKRVEATDLSGDKTKWMVVVDYDTDHDDDPDDPDEEEPEDQRPTVTVRFDRVQRVLQGSYDETATGKVSATVGVNNSADQPFNPPPMVDEARLVLQIERRERFVDMALLSSLQDLTNSTPYIGAATNTMKLNITGVEETFEKGATVWVVNIELAYNKKGWDIQLLDHGHKLNEDTGNYDLILLKDGSATTTPDYLTFTPYGTANFNTINLLRGLTSRF